MNYDLTFKPDIKKIDFKGVSIKSVAKHFADNGYDFLYVYKNGKFFNVITFSDFMSGNFFEQGDKKFIQPVVKFKSFKDVQRFFEDNPDIERLVLVDAGEIVCEFNPRIELPLQNNVAKNLMALRYVCLFREELVQYLAAFDKISVIAKGYIADFIAEILPEIKFDSVTQIESVEEILSSDLILDFYFGKKLRKALNFKFKVTDFSSIVERIALDTLINYCVENNLILKFYKLQRYEGLNCLHAWEEENFQNRKTLRQLLCNRNYVENFVASDAEYEYIRRQEFFSSERLDDGYCFVQSDCKTNGLTVLNGLRYSAYENFNSRRVINVYGPCTTFGILTTDFNTVTSQLNRMFRNSLSDCSAINHGGLHGNNVLNSIMCALRTPVKSGDAIVLLDVLDDFKLDIYPGLIEVNDWFNVKKKKRELMFFDFPGHCNAKANKIIAEGIFKDLSRYPLIKNFGAEKFTWFSLNRINFNVKRDFHNTNALAVKFRNGF